MKIPVYFLYVNPEIGDWVETVELDNTFEKRKMGNFGPEKKKELLEKWSEEPPGVYVTIHPDFVPFQCLNTLPYELRRRWLYFKDTESFQSFFPVNCYANYIFDHHNDMNPLLSVFTTTYKSRHRILRPYNSLMNQIYQNWEWIIIDDTEEDYESAEEHMEMLKNLEASDHRIRVYKPLKHSGYIGALKKQACGLAYGEWLIEMDHDDDIVPELFQWIVNIHRKYKDATFIYSDCIETHEDNFQNHSYGDFFGLGYGAYYTTLYNNMFQHVCIGCPINRLTMSHIVGVPNHIRVWKKSFYDKIGGHNRHLPVADDYELILRTVLESDCWVRIAHLGYIQYRNRGGNNFTFLRNQLIQDLVRITSCVYSERLRLRFNDLFKINEEGPVKRLDKQIYKQHKFDYPVPEKVYIDNPPLFAIIMPTYNRPQHLIKAINSILQQTYQNWELYVIGDKCPVLNQVMEDMRVSGKYDKRIRWWNFNDNNGAGGAVPRNYALYLAQTEWIAYLDDDNEWFPDHLQTSVDLIEKNPDVQYMFSSFKIDGNDEQIHTVEVPVWGGLDTSAVIHKRELIFKYGLWKNREDGGYAHDWEYFSRFKTEKWLATLKPTLNYSTEFNGQSYESIKQIYEHSKKQYLEENPQIKI
jgi:O-antigen biosynthesis protein